MPYGRARAVSPEQRLAEINTELERLAAERRRRIEEQTDVGDCALSSWADGITRSKLEMEKELIEAGGKACFLALVTLSGEPVRAKIISSRFGQCWALLGPNGRYAGFLPVCDAAVEPGQPYVAHDKKIQKKGYRQVAVLRPAKVEVVGSGHGLSGSARPAVIDLETGQGSCAYLPSEGANV